MVLTAFAPMASPVFTRSSTITIGPLSVLMTFTLMSFAPPPSETSMGSCSLALARSALFFASSLLAAACGFGTPTVWICPIITGPVFVTLKPPFTLAIFAALLAAATTEGSSSAMGTT